MHWHEMKSAPKDGSYVLLMLDEGDLVCRWADSRWVMEDGKQIESQPQGWWPAQQPDADSGPNRATPLD
jgi:hypothetical protein